MAVQLVRRLMTVEEYHRMVEVGILTENDRVELINGEILEMSPIGSKHAAIVDRIKDWFVLETAGKAITRVQNPIVVNELSEPEPDIVLAKFRKDYYEKEHPTPQDIFLIIEIADTSFIFDREIKLPIYAEAGVPEYWIVNLEARQIEIYREPTGKDYRLRILANPEDDIDLKGLDLKIPVKKLLG